MFSDAINICKTAIQAVFNWAFGGDGFEGLFTSIGGLGFIVFFLIVFIFIFRVIGLKTAFYAGSDAVKKGVTKFPEKINQ